MKAPTLMERIYAQVLAESPLILDVRERHVYVVNEIDSWTNYSLINAISQALSEEP